MPSSPPQKKQSGFSLIELVTVLLIITVLSTIAIRSTVDIGYSARYEQTRDRLESIRKAIVGNTKRSINGQPDISGFVADMGRLPDNIRELIQRYDCTTPLGASPANCTTPASPDWLDSIGTLVNTTSSLRYGWNGPYLNTSDNPNNSDAYTDGWGRESQGYCSDPIITEQTLCVDSDIWIVEASDYNYGWYFDSITDFPDVIFFSYGKDQIYGGTPPDYDAEYPVSKPIIGGDWQIDIGSGGISVTFLKPYVPNAPSISSPPTSLCTNPTVITQAACTSPHTWYGGCDNAGFLNKDSCTGTWQSCSDGTSLNKTACEGASEHWYGDGYGCSVQYHINKAACLGASATWRGCTDDGTILDQDICIANDEIWYGDNLYSVEYPTQNNSYNNQDICLNVFYRQSSDSEVTHTSSTLVSIEENGSYQTINFSGFGMTNIPIGINAIGIYEHDGDCDTNNNIYPSDRSPIRVMFVSNNDLPVINW